MVLRMKNKGEGDTIAKYQVNNSYEKFRWGFTILFSVYVYKIFRTNSYVMNRH